LSSISLSGLLASWCRFLGHLQWLCAAFNNRLTQSNAQLLNTEYCTDNTRYREHCPAARQCNAGYPGRAKQIHAANAIRKAWGLQLGISTSVQRPLRAVRPKINFSFDRWPLLQVLRKVSKPEHCGVKLANGSNFLELTRTTFYHNLSQPSVRLSTYKVSTLSQHSLKTTAKFWGEIGQLVPLPAADQENLRLSKYDMISPGVADGHRRPSTECRAFPKLSSSGNFI
jgi:hypothetical protein